MTEVETGSTSVHVGSTDDKPNIEKLNWEGVGISKVFSRALKIAAISKDVVESYRAFTKGDAGFRALMSDLARLEKQF